MADTTTRFIMEAIDKASAVINKVGGAVGKTGGQFKDLANEIPGLNQAMTLMTNPLALTGAGIAAAGKFAADATVETQKYNKEIRDLAQNLNRSTEETSRIVQTMDDFGVSQASVTTALELALKNGFAPSIDTLAKMADAYREIEDPNERAAKLTEVFGRNWAELVPALKMGGQAIRDAAAAQSDALLVTEEAAQAAREYDKALDGLGDTVTGIKYRVGNSLIPPLTAAANSMNDVALAQDLWDKAIKRGLQAQAYQLTQGKDLATNIAALTKLVEDHDRALAASKKSQEDFRNEERGITLSVEDHAEAEMRLAETMDRRTEVIPETTRTLHLLGVEYTYTIDQSKELTKAIELEGTAATRELDKIQTALNQTASFDFTTVDFGLSTNIARELSRINVMMAGGGEFDEAFKQIGILLDKNKITPQQAKDYLADVEVNWIKKLVEAGEMSAAEGKKAIQETLKVTPQEADEIWKELPKSAQDIMDGVMLDIKATVSVVSINGLPGPTVLPSNNPNYKPPEENASGGDVFSGVPSWVGDGGEPELFVPKSDGTIVPKHNIPGGTGGITVINNFNAPVSSQAEARDGANQGVLAALRAAGRA